MTSTPTFVELDTAIDVLRWLEDGHGVEVGWHGRTCRWVLIRLQDELYAEHKPTVDGRSRT